MLGLPDDRWVEQMSAQALPTCQPFRLRHRADIAFIVTMGARIIQMQSGFAMLESAYAQPNNSANIMMKNMLDLFIGVLAFYLFGYCIAYGDTHDVGFADTGYDLAHWFCSFSYATTAATINSGALAGRVAFFPYLVLSTVMTGVVYPISARLVWGGGWLQQMGFVDFAGSATVHLVGAVSAVVATCFVGPRIGRFKEYRAWRAPWNVIFLEKNDDKYYREPEAPVEKKVFVPFRRCRHPVQLLFGTFLLLVGFLAFNPASTFATTADKDLTVAYSSVTTLLASAGAGVGGMLFSVVSARAAVVRVPELTNAVVGGLVASCACCSVIPVPIAPLVGFVAALLTLSFEELLARFQIDDAVGAVAAHGPSGAWGTLAVALFANKHCGDNHDYSGIFFGGGDAAWRLLGVQALGISVLMAISLTSTYFVVMLVDLLFGFRVSRACELIGLDFWEHQFDDGSLDAGSHKATLYGLSKMREDLSRRSRYLEVSPRKWWTLPKGLSGSSAPGGLSEASTAGTDAEQSTAGAEGEREAGSDRKMEELMRKVQALEHQISLLTVGALRNAQSAEPGTFEDICGRGVRSEICIPPSPTEPSASEPKAHKVVP